MAGASEVRGAVRAVRDGVVKAAEEHGVEGLHVLRARHDVQRPGEWGQGRQRRAVRDGAELTGVFINEPPIHVTHNESASCGSENSDLQ